MKTQNLWDTLNNNNNNKTQQSCEGSLRLQVLLNFLVKEPGSLFHFQFTKEPKLRLNLSLSFGSLPHTGTAHDISLQKLSRGALSGQKISFGDLHVHYFPSFNFSFGKQAVHVTMSSLSRNISSLFLDDDTENICPFFNLLLSRIQTSQRPSKQRPHQ